VNGGYNQDWEFVQSPYAGYYEIMNRGSGQCLSVGNDSTAAGQDLVQYPCHGWTDQLWYMGYIAQATCDALRLVGLKLVFLTVSSAMSRAL
jgi:hypothetical protein